MKQGEEKKETSNKEQNLEANFAAANDKSDLQEDYRDKPLDKIEGQMNNGELGAGLREEQSEKGN